MDVFSLTETEFFQKLTEGKNDNLHIAYKDFVLRVSEMCSKENSKGCVISALLFVEVEISHIQTASQRKEVNEALASFIDKALQFVHQTIVLYKEVEFRPIDPGMPEEIGLSWRANKTALIELGYAFKVANCFGANLSAKDIIGKLARMFKVDMTDGYIYKKYAEMRVRARNSRTYFMDTLIDGLNSFMSKQDEED